MNQHLCDEHRVGLNPNRAHTYLVVSEKSTLSSIRLLFDCIYVSIEKVLTGG